MDEIVALYDDRGRPAGRAPRSEVRAQNLHHAATVVLVRDPFGRLYVHRRTLTKDVFPGYWDFAVGGVLLADEDPLEGARREVAEELGITPDLEALGEADYRDDHTSYRAFLYLTEWDGPVTPQVEEIAYGGWLPIERLWQQLRDPQIEFVPDTRALLEHWVTHRAHDRRTPDQGWDTISTIVEDRWLDREPRFPDIARALVAETRLMPRLAPRLPLDAPVATVMDEEPVRVRHALVPGDPLTSATPLDASHGRQLGEFLLALHRTPSSVYDGTGIVDDVASRAELMATLDRMLHRVLPMVPGEQQEAASALLRQVVARTPVALVHGAIGPGHVLLVEGRLSAVIDWADARLADPAIDLAWPLFGTPEPFAAAVAQSYGVTDEQLARALVWHRFAPWYDALWGQAAGGPEYAESGVKQILERLDVT